MRQRTASMYGNTRTLAVLGWGEHYRGMRYLGALLVLVGGCAAPAADVVACVLGPEQADGSRTPIAACPMDGVPRETEGIWWSCDGPQWIVDEEGCRIFIDNSYPRCTAITPSIACTNGDVLRCGWAQIPDPGQCIRMWEMCPEGGCLFDPFL